MATFDPDAYLAKTQGFDPDAYLAKNRGAAAAPDGYEFPRAIGRQVVNAAAGAVRGAGSIGATIMRPFESAEENANRRTAMDEALQSLVGADPDSIAYGGGKLVAEVAGTSGLGGLIAKPVGAILGRVAPSVAPAVTTALNTAGMSTGTAPATLAAKAGDLAIRTGAGAAVGGASAGLVNPEDAATGAMIGGALPATLKVAKAAGAGVKNAVSGAAKHALGLSTGTGGESVATAYQAGKQGGTSFLDNMRGKVPFTDVLDEAKSALSQMRIDRSNAYKQGMAGVSADKTVIDFTPIDSAVNSLKAMGNYKGQVINKNASGTVDEISNLVSQWKALDPAEFHTPEGLDALKQAISDIRDTTQYGTAARKAADTAYNAVKSEITKQAPTYAKVMKDYSEASELVKEIERSLVGNDKTSADTAMRKLQSLMRNNVNTNYGNRLDLAKTLESKGADILPAVAGQAMSSMTPRGLQALSAGGIAGLGVVNANPLALALLPTTSPRLVGEAAYGLGALNRGVGNAVNARAIELANALARAGKQPLDINQIAPLLATGSVLSASQQ